MLLCFGPVLALITTSAHANLITNGDFATNASGWTYNNQGIDGGYLASEGNPAGSFWINHNGNPVPSGDPDPKLSQAISTVIGSQYELSFDYSGRVIFGSVFDGLAVDINGVEFDTYLIPNANWMTATLLFTASGANTEIAFRSEINGTDYDARLDNVSVVLHQNGNGVPAVPIPPALPLFFSGLAGMGFLARRKKLGA
jgi:hypothetical protein